MQLNLGSDPKDLIAAIGPCIRACCFVIGPEVRTHFEAEFPYAAELFSERPMQNAPAQMHMDLQQANRRQLLSSGIPALAISTLAECSACSRLPNGKRKYFSHRAENGFTGRMMSVIGATS
jgi:copper oxidase (laccase) domain-containing protein